MLDLPLTCRTRHDLPLHAAYQWYISQHQPGRHPTHPDGHFGFVVINDKAALLHMNATLLDFQDRLRTRDPAAITISQTPQYNGRPVFWQAVAAMDMYRNGQYGPHRVNRTTAYQRSLAAAWSQDGTKIICMQDDVSVGYVIGRQLLDPVIVAFLQERYPQPSQYELPAGMSNGCR